MSEPDLYPLGFAPIFQYRLWGGRRLGDWMDAKLPGDKDNTIGEAWILSDRQDHASPVIDGPLKDATLTELMKSAPRGLLGRYAGKTDRFPLLLKFLDVEQMLSVQVHPRDDQKALIPKGDTGKTEAWVVLQADAKSRIYAGLKPHTDADILRKLDNDNVDDHLASFAPKVGQAVLIQSGTVHSLGDGVMVFEVQENSDTTFRLYDWNHIDPQTKKPRDLQVDQALQSVNFDQGVIQPTTPKAEGEGRERVFDNPHFGLDRYDTSNPFTVGVADEPRVLVCVAGKGAVEYGGKAYPMKRGGVTVLPAALGACRFVPDGAVTLLDISMPDVNAIPEPA